MSQAKELERIWQLVNILESIRNMKTKHQTIKKNAWTNWNGNFQRWNTSFQKCMKLFNIFRYHKKQIKHHWKSSSPAMKLLPRFKQHPCATISHVMWRVLQGLKVSRWWCSFRRLCNLWNTDVSCRSIPMWINCNTWFDSNL